MRKFLTAFAAAAVLVLTALPSLAAGAPTTRGGAIKILTNPRLLAHYLELSADQVTQQKALLTALQNTVKPLRDARPALCATAESAIETDPADAATVGDAFIALYDNKQAAKDAAHTFDTDFSAILTAEQLAKYNALKQLAAIEDDTYFSIVGPCPKPQNN